MNTIVQTTLPFILLYKYWALFGITFFTALALPIPPGTLIMASAAFAYNGYFNFGWVLVVAILGNILGDNAGYWIAREYGISIFKKIGLSRVLDSRRYRRIQAVIRKRPGLIIFISRFEVVTNLSVNLIAGLGRVPYRTYLLYEVIGEILQVTLYSTIGYVFANSWHQVSTIIGKVLFAIVAVGILVAFLFWRKGRKHTGEEDALLS